MKLPQRGHLSGCFQSRIRCREDVGQAGLNLIQTGEPRGQSRFKARVNCGGWTGG